MNVIIELFTRLEMNFFGNEERMNRYSEHIWHFHWSVYSTIDDRILSLWQQATPCGRFLFDDFFIIYGHFSDILSTKNPVDMVVFVVHTT